MELWDLYTADRELTGETMVRGEPVPKGRYHLVVHVWIRNSAGQFLISQRAAGKAAFPLMWESVGGAVTAGEDSLTAALRETEEEVGVQLDPACGRRLHSTRREHFRDIMDDWLFHYDGDTDLRRATTDEVAQMRWMTVEEIRQLWNEGLMVHTLAYFFDDPALGGQALTDFDHINPCGESCTGCAKHRQGLCGGCRERGGRCEEWAGSGICPVYACAAEHEVLFCGLCPEFPCPHLPMQRWRPDCVRELTALRDEYRALHP